MGLRSHETECWAPRIRPTYSQGVLGIMPIDWTAIGSIATGIGVIWAVEQSRRERKHSRLALGIQILLEYEAKFESIEWRQKRAAAARHLLGSDPNPTRGERAVTDVLNYFEMICSLVQQDILDIRAVWHSFGGWILSYYRLAESYVTVWRKENSSSLKDLGDLYDRILRIELAERCLVDGTPGAFRLEDESFAAREAVLDQLGHGPEDNLPMPLSKVPIQPDL
jgi:hypothetical protein